MQMLLIYWSFEVWCNTLSIFNESDKMVNVVTTLELKKE